MINLTNEQIATTLKNAGVSEPITFSEGKGWRAVGIERQIDGHTMKHAIRLMTGDTAESLAGSFKEWEAEV